MTLSLAIVTSVLGAGIGGFTGTAAAKSAFTEDEMKFCENPVVDRVDEDGDGYLSSFEICIDADTMIQDGTIGKRDIPPNHSPLISEGHPKFAYFGIIEKGGKKRPVLLGIKEVDPSPTAKELGIKKEITLQGQAGKRNIYLDDHDIEEIRVMYVESDSSPNALVLKDVDTIKAVGSGVKGTAKVAAGTALIVSGAVPAGISTIGSASGDGVTVAKSIKKSWSSDDHIDTDATLLADPIRLEQSENDRQAQLEVTSNAQGAEVLVDGTKVGTTPWSKQYPVDAGDRQGKKTITVRKNGYVSESKTVSLSPPQTLHFDLDRVTKPISVVAAEDGRAVSVDGQRVGSTPWEGQRWVEGSYDVTVENVQMENGTTGDRTFSGVTPPATINASTVSDGSSDLPIGQGGYDPGDIDVDPDFDRGIDPDVDLALVPSARFVASPSSSSVGQPVSFDASNSYAVGNATYEWRFGDGAVESSSSPVTSHAYDSAGSYTANLTVTDENGHTASVEKSVEIENAAPDAGLVASTRQPLTGKSVRLDAGPSTDPEGSLVRYAWDFDSDGREEATGRTVSHTYANAGQHVVNLTVTDGAGNTDSTSQQLVVRRPNAAPQAQFDVQQRSSGQRVTVDASSSRDPDGSIRSYTWEFGDGSKTNGETVSHSYDRDGTYRIRLLVTDDRGSIATTTKTVSVTGSADSGQTATPNPAQSAGDTQTPAQTETPNPAQSAGDTQTPAQTETPTPATQPSPAQTPAQTDQPSPAQTPAPAETDGGDGPGFGLLAAALALVLAVLLAAVGVLARR